MAKVCYGFNIYNLFPAYTIKLREANYKFSLFNIRYVNVDKAYGRDSSIFTADYNSIFITEK